MHKWLQQKNCKIQLNVFMGLVLSACGGSTGNLDQSEKQNNEGGINTTSPAKVYNEILGNDNDEILFGSTGNDHIIAGSGNDQIYSGEGNDWLEGGKGNDLFYLSVGFHDIDGGDDVDTIVVDQGSTVDFLNLDLDSSTFHFSNSIPTKVGSITSVENVEVSKNIDTIILISGSNSNISTAGGSDLIYAFADNMTISTSRGDDSVFLKSSTGSIDGGPGADLLLIDESEASSVIVNLAEQKVSFLSGLNKTVDVSNFENITIKNSTDGNTVIGNSENNIIVGSTYNDTLRGGIGDDTLTGGDGTDIFVYVAADVGSSFDTLDRITDFEAGKNGDKLSIASNGLITSNSASIQGIDLSLPTVANTINGNSILLITDGNGFSDKSEVLVNLATNASYSNLTGGEVKLLAIWYNRTKETVDVSVVTDTLGQNQSFDQIDTFLELTGKSETFIDELTSDNFIIS